MKQMKRMKEQNSNMINACKEILNKSKVQRSNTVRKLEYDTNLNKTPPTPTRTIPILSEVTEYSQLLLTQNDYETPKKNVHYKINDYSDSDDDSLIQKMIEDKDKTKSNKNNEDNPPKIQRKRVRTKK